MSGIPGLIADIGGTNARFALADEHGFTQEKVLQCADYHGLAEAAQEYLKGIEGPRPVRAAFAIAGPVKGDIFKMTNHVWKFSIEETRLALGLQSFDLLNDFKAVALGIPHLGAEFIQQVGGNHQREEGGAIGIIGPGTGLGVASLTWDGQRYIPNPGEGGHVTMAAKTQREFDIIQKVKELGPIVGIDEEPPGPYSHVSAERVCSGKGLEKIYRAICHLDGRTDLAQRTAGEISKAAIDGSCDVSVESLDKMLGFLGTVAGDLALTVGTKGGVYIAGGIPLKLGDHFFSSRFRSEFDDKGRMRDFVKDIPTYLITHKFIALVGLQHHLLDTAPALP